jgi:serine/threonine-protein kinase
MEDDLERRALERIGRTLREKYRLERLLGVGGMAAVYAAEHRNGRHVAVKMLHPELSMHREIRERFLREGQAANRVGHPGAVAVLDDDVSDDGAAFLVMELLEGDSLENLSQRGVLSESVLCAVAVELLGVLAAAHEHGIVHRDIKPANLFVTNDGQLKVLDFGIARVTSSSAGATQTGMMLGTPAFMAPEQALGRTQQIDARTDLWAVGATLFSLASGQSVHPAETAQETAIKAATQPAPSLATLCPSLKRELVQIIDTALAFEAASRWPSASAMREAIQAAGYSGASARADLQALVSGAEGALLGAPLPAQHAAPRSTDWASVTGAAAASSRGRAAARPLVSRALLGLAALVILGSLTAAWRARGRSTEPVASSAAATATSVIETAPAPASPSVSSSSSPVQTPATPAAQASTRPALAPPAAASQARIGVATPKSSVATVSTSSPEPAAKPKQSCSPPYVLDASGNKRWKRECL